MKKKRGSLERTNCLWKNCPVIVLLKEIALKGQLYLVENQLSSLEQNRTAIKCLGNIYSIR